MTTDILAEAIQHGRIEYNETTIPKIIGIAGGSASGKSSLARALSNKFKFRVPVISQDWYYCELANKSLGPTHNWDEPSSFDMTAIASALRLWKAGLGVSTPRHNYNDYSRTHNVEWIDSAPVMIFEGILAFQDPEIASLLDYKVYIDCDVDIALGRRIKRDQIERGYTYDDIMTRYESHVKPAFDSHIAPLRKIADIVINNTERRDPATLKALDMVSALVAEANRGRNEKRSIDRSRRFTSR